MIDIKSLRVGNWVKFNNNHQQVIALRYGFTSSPDMVILMPDHGTPSWQPVNDCEGIELTPEILEAAGFENKKIDNLEFLHNDDLIIKGFEHDYNGLYFGKIEYLHQLQNLYYALTGTELEINLKEVVG